MWALLYVHLDQPTFTATFTPDEFGPMVMHPMIVR